MESGINPYWLFKITIHKRALLCIEVFAISIKNNKAAAQAVRQPIGFKVLYSDFTV
ncbi:MAG: hypothetical protein II059_02915 [Clostridia bacterium]|nr:hypothetical protein [Clostridia bacterium]